MGEIIKNLLSRNKNKVIIIFLKNNFRFEGTLKDFDEKYLELFDFVEGGNVLIELDEIAEVKEGRNDN